MEEIGIDCTKMATRRKFLEKVIKTAEALLQTGDINRGKYNITKYVVLHFHVKAIKLAKGISALCDAKLMSDAKILLRPLFDVAYYCEYILLDPKDITAAENILAIASIEDKITEDNIKKHGGVDIDKMAVDENDRKFLKDRVPQRAQIREDNYDFIVERIRKRSSGYNSLSADGILNKEGIKNKSFLKEVNQRFNKETNTKDFWRKYKTILRDCSRSIHVTDFETNVIIENKKLEYKLNEREKTGEVILSATASFLIRIIDVTNEIFDFKADNEIKELFNEARRVLQ